MEKKKVVGGKTRREGPTFLRDAPGGNVARHWSDKEKSRQSMDDAYEIRGIKAYRTSTAKHW
jgi:hypothetical protein